MSSQLNKSKRPIPNVIIALFGGSTGTLATCVVHPLNVVKIRMQLSGQTGEKVTASSVVANVLKNEGVRGLYSGLTASMLRQATYTTARLGVYSWLFDLMKALDGAPPSFLMKVVLGVAAGMCGGLVGTPAEICLVRMTSDGLLSPEKRRNYTHVGSAMVRIIKEEGVLTLWRGGILTMSRACVVNATQLATYSELKQFFITKKGYNDSFIVHFAASLSAGLATAVTALPVDIIKTRVQSMNIEEHKGAVHVFVKLLRKEGMFALWRGFLPYYARIGPHTMLTFMMFEQLQYVYRHNFM